ncbi:sulfotransferase [Maliponia aquimaris]|uniref:Sulfotransferase domain protein n=1 Tax=Maliponia aquimaris TaxID=1673631 RepID=A0A238L4I9_9RHOB|nr:sulfotransferase [Maliponia aquimaris]SMX50005.1 Sulfotransferase domain protein [Maliponia aquimaris]
MTGVATRPRRLILLFSGPRSGSNYLVDILNKIPGTIAVSEIFNPRAVYGLNLHPMLEARMLKDFGSQDALWREMRMSPETSMTRLLDGVPPEMKVIVKVLPNQVHARAMKQIIEQHAMGAIFLTRKRLDQFVSLRKALMAGDWFHADTTSLRPEVHCGGFLSWTAALEDWLRDMVSIANTAGIVDVHLNYERDLRDGTARDIAERLHARLAPLGIANSPDEMASESWYTRQDRSEDPFDKISNKDALRAELARIGYLDEALRAPRVGSAPEDTPPPDLVANPAAGASLIRQGDFGRLRAALYRIGRDVAPGDSRPEDLPSAAHGFERFTFVCGLHRSGTTLLHDSIAARFDVATLHHDSAPRSEGQFLQYALPQEAPFGGPGHFAFAPQMTPQPVRDRRRAADLRQQICGTWAPHTDKPDHPHLLEKSPTNLTRIGWLRSVFPTARFVVLVRDPRAVSLATRDERPISLDLLLAHWQAAHLSALSQMAEDCHVLRYEDLCEDPDRELDRIGAFCGLTPRAVPGPATEIRPSNAHDLRHWPDDLYFAPDLKIWEVFGYTL